MDGPQRAWDVQIAQFCALFEQRAQDTVTRTVLMLGTSLVEKSPVGDPSLWKHKPPPGYVGGRFRANWQHGYNVSPSGEISGADPSGQEAINRLASAIRQTTGYGLHYLQNNLPYGTRLEYGHSSQAPNGFVGLTVNEFQQMVEQAVKDAKAK